MSRSLRILHISAEVSPWAKTGGLGDVVGALPKSLAALPDTQVATVLPRYRSVEDVLHRQGQTLVDTGVQTTVWFDGEQVWGRFFQLEGAPIYFLQCARFFERDGIYGDSHGGFGDNPERYIFLSRAAFQGAAALMGGSPDVIHCHDWHTGLVCGLNATTERFRHPRAATVFTIHNLAHQGVCSSDLLYTSGLDSSGFHPEGAEFHGHLNLLKAGAAFADAVTTVSPTYAREISTHQGYGLEGLLRRRGVRGIVNGIDDTVWNPRIDPHIAATYDESLEGKAACRQALLDEVGLQANEHELVLGVVSRLVHQKGIDLIAGLVPHLHALGAKLVLLGTGSHELQDHLRHLSSLFSHHFRAVIDFDEGLAHRITAGADAILMPSRFEPCGLNQLYALAYGTPPIVHAVGGLADTVPAHVGFRFDHPTVAGLHWAVSRAAHVFHHDRDAWHRLQRGGMAEDHSWARSAARYRALYAEVAR